MPKKTSYFFILITIIGLIFLANGLILAWAPPSSPSPGGNVPSPLNIGSTGQSKAGGLILNTGGADYGLIVDQGKVGVGLTDPGEKLEVDGNVKAAAFLYSSDRRLKRNIQKITGALEKIQQIDGVSFEWNKDGRPSIGLIAQDVEKVFPEAVSTNEKTGLKSLQYGNLAAALIEAIKEQQTQIEELRIEIENLKK